MKRIAIIINPSSGRQFPILHTLHKVLSDKKIDWDIYVTKRPQEIADYTKRALREHADAIAIYGGDGTVREAAGVLVKEKKPLLILPGGTANVISNELGIPQDIEKAIKLFLSKHRVRAIDVGQIGDQFFLTRVSNGFEAEVVRETTPDIKTKIGWLAYALNSLKAALKTRASIYKLKLDGKDYQEQGLACIVANSGNLGLPGITISPKIKVNDGLFDVILINHADLRKIYKQQQVFRGFFRHWQCREIEITTEPRHDFQCDGELHPKMPIHIKVVPQALKVITPG